MKRLATSAIALVGLRPRGAQRNSPSDRYKYRTTSLRNVAVEAAFMHDGAFTSLAAAIRHHLNPAASLLAYDSASQHLAPDLAEPIGPRVPLLAALDPRLVSSTKLSPTEFDDLLVFVRDGLLDERATPRELHRLVPHHVPSGNPTLTFEFDTPLHAAVPSR